MIRTSTGKEFTVDWCAVSTIDGSLRFQLNNSNMVEAFSAFSDSAETELMGYFVDGELHESYEGYTDLRQISLDTQDSVLIVLAKG